jgi:hypothetical protein
MSTELVTDLLEQFQRTSRMLEAEIKRFSPEQWGKGINFFQTPAVQAMHLYDCLDYYFCGRNGDDYTWGHHFGGGWWELPEERWPSQETLLAYACELQARIETYFAGLDDGALAQPAPVDDSSGKTRLGHAIYALRHTVHHHGQLVTLAVYHTGDGG